MPEPEGSDAGDRQENDEKLDRGGRQNKSKGSKTKDLSHVPCKFFRVGGCTAGDNCPFSHNTMEPGQQKNVCAWFVKGQCKFGHKCALAHILPGQPMSMDRKNKKAAQAANAQLLGPEGSRGQGQGGSQQGDRTRKRRSQPPKEATTGGEPSPNPDVGETIVLPPTTGSSPPGPTIRIRQPTGHGTKISPVSITASMPAPPVRNTDFHFGMPDELPDSVPPVPVPAPATVASPAMVPSPTKPTLPPRLQAVRRLSASASSGSGPIEPAPRSPPGFESVITNRPSPLSMPPPTRTDSGSLISPTRAKRLSGGDYGFGPIGSPTRASFAANNHVPSPSLHNEAYRPEGVSPGTSPSGRLSGGGFLSSSPFGVQLMSYSLDHRDIAASAGFGLPNGDRAVLNRIREGGRRTSLDLLNEDAVAGDDEELEEFLPSSLSELLTPGERMRRKSRTGARPSLEAHHQRFAQSVPAASTLDNLKGIWKDVSTTSSPGIPPQTTTSGPFHGEDQISPSLLSTSNASAAFLGHAHAQANRPAMQSLRSFDPNMLDRAHFASPSDPIATPSHRPRASRASLDASLLRLPPFHPPAGFGGLEDPASPTALALQEHAPGQSLPQGLAAGLSRLHLLPSQQTPSPGSTPSGMDIWGDPNGRPSIYGSSPRALASPTFPRSNSSRDAIAIPSASYKGLSMMGRRANAFSLTSPLSKPALRDDDLDDHLFDMDDEK